MKCIYGLRYYDICRRAEKKEDEWKIIRCNIPRRSFKKDSMQNSIGGDDRLRRMQTVLEENLCISKVNVGKGPAKVY